MAENEDLKTLGDIEDRELERVPGGVEDTLISERALKQAAIAWVQHMNGVYDNIPNRDDDNMEALCTLAILAWIMHFFGLTEEDVGE